MPHVFQTEQWLPFPRDLVFAFFANPQNLPPLMPQWQKARIDKMTLVPPPPRPADTRAFPGIAAGSGTKLLITARGIPFLPLRQPWEALIGDFHWNQGFCDLQVKGPFAYWHHCHSVTDARSATAGNAGQPGTLVRDHVTYALPLEPLSRLGLPAVRAALRALFRYRQARAAELLPRFAQTLASL